MTLQRPLATWTRGLVATLVLVAVAAGFGYLASGLTPVTSSTLARPAGVPGAVDVGFCQDMAFHHDQAVLMAILALDRAGPTVKALASSILVSQSRQIGIMRGWLQLWGQPFVNPQPMAWMSKVVGASPPSVAGVRIRYCGLNPDGSMPGMATPEELNELWRRSGKAFDVLFMQLMIRHHESGILMSHDAALHARLAPVRNAAHVMVIQQAQDVAMMRRLLQVDGARPLPFP